MIRELTPRQRIAAAFWDFWDAFTSRCERDHHFTAYAVGTVALVSFLVGIVIGGLWL